MVAGYDRSAAIRLQNTMPARPNSKKPYEANSANLTTREKSVTTMRHKAMLGAHGGKNFHQGRAPLAGKGAE